MLYLYLIKNKINKRCYVGITKNYVNRFQEHRRGSKSNRILQSAFQKYGYDNFEFELVYQGSKDEITNLEMMVVTKDDYNLTYGGGMPPIFYGSDNPSSKNEVREKISKAQKGVPRKPQTQEHKDLMRSYFKGRPKTPNSGTSYKRIKCLNDGLIFDSMQEAADFYKIDRACVSRVARGLKTPSHAGGCNFIIIEEHREY